MQDEDTQQQPQADEPKADDADQAVNEPAEEAESESPTEEPEAESKEEAEEPQAEPQEATPEEPKASSRKGKGAEKRIPQLLAKLKEKGQPNQLTQSQAQGVLDDFQEQGVPDSISATDLQHLQQVAAGRVQAQQDARTAEQELRLAKLEMDNRVTRHENVLRSAELKYEELNENSDAYDPQLEKAVTKRLESVIEKSPDLDFDAERIIDDAMEMARLGASRGKEGTTATLAKQAAGSALAPGKGRKAPTSNPKEMSDEELMKAAERDAQQSKS